MKKSFIYLLLLFAIGSNVKAQWVLTNAPKNVPIYSFAYNGSNVFAGGDLTGLVATGGTVFLSTNNGLDWAIIGITPACPEIRTILLDDTNIFAGSFGGGVFLSTNMGGNWVNVSNGLTDTDVYTLLITPNGLVGKIIYAGTIGGGIFLSTNYGANWYSINNGLTNLEIYSLDYIQNEANDIILFAGTGGNGVFVSTNNGALWTQTTLNNDYVWALAAIGNNIFASAGGLTVGGLFLSTDNGVSWTNVSISIGSTGYLATSGTNLFVTARSNVYLTTDNGGNWTLVSQGIQDTLVQALGINGNYIFAGGENGVWRRPLSELITALESSSDLPTNFILEQNYPNPFNPSTKISFVIPNSSLVILKVYDILGNEVTTLVNEEKPAGTYEVIWNAANLPSGVYFYRLKAGSFTATKKLLLLK